MADSGYPIGIISIHALHEESDAIPTPEALPEGLFQSTLSMRRATFFVCEGTAAHFHFNPRSP